MLVRLNNRLIPDYWPTIKEAVRECVPGTADMFPDRMAKLLEAALTECVQCWILVQDEQLLGVAVTKIGEDELSGQSCFLIYALKFFGTVKGQIRTDAWNGLCDYARSVGCRCMTAFCSSPMVANAAVKMHGNGEVYHYMLFPV